MKKGGLCVIQKAIEHFNRFVKSCFPEDYHQLYYLAAALTFREREKGNFSSQCGSGTLIAGDHWMGPLRAYSH